MLLRHSLDLDTEAAAVEAAVWRAIDKGVLTGDLLGGGRTGASTKEAGGAVIEALANT